jgi:putative membrane protein
MEEKSVPEAQKLAEGNREDSTARDRLAVERTVLANERTLLAYVRTALALFVVGITFIHLQGLHPEPGLWSLAYHTAGWLFLAAAAAVGVISYRRYRAFQELINRFR